MVTRSSSAEGPSLFTPRRRREPELLDDPSVDPDIRHRATADIVRSNRWLGGRRAALAELAHTLSALSDERWNSTLTLLDVGTGLGDIPGDAGTLAKRYGLALETIGVDRAPSLLASVAADRLHERVNADGLALPFADHSVDIVMCSQVLHHFDYDGAVALVRELDRVARRRVILCDLRRSWIAASGFHVAALALRFHPVTRRDGFTSVLKGFTTRELREIVTHATTVRPRARRRLGYRLTASWSPVG